MTHVSICSGALRAPGRVTKRRILENMATTLYARFRPLNSRCDRGPILSERADCSQRRRTLPGAAKRRCCRTPMRFWEEPLVDWSGAGCVFFGTFYAAPSFPYSRLLGAALIAYCLP